MNVIRFLKYFLYFSDLKLYYIVIIKFFQLKLLYNKKKYRALSHHTKILNIREVYSD